MILSALWSFIDLHFYSINLHICSKDTKTKRFKEWWGQFILHRNHHQLECVVFYSNKIYRSCFWTKIFTEISEIKKNGYYIQWGEIAWSFSFIFNVREALLVYFICRITQDEDSFLVCGILENAQQNFSIFFWSVPILVLPICHCLLKFYFWKTDNTFSS